MATSQSSSPDPLALSNENYRASLIRRPSISPRKPLSTASGNARTQDFYITTPPAKAKRASKNGQRPSDSPWRIRLTVQAEQMEDSGEVSLPKVMQGTTTTMIPLKGGDDDSPEIKRGRGRPRKSLDDKRVRNGTPKLKTKPSRKTMSDLESSTQEIPALTPPRYNKSKSAADIDNSPSRRSPAKCTPERLVKARPFTRSRSRSRRREITPRKMGSFVEEESEVKAAVLPDRSAPQGPQETSSLHEATEQPGQKSPGYKDTENPSSSNERSTQEIEEEMMWRDMIRKDSVSPGQASAPETVQSSLDPTEQHQDYDTILESEGFSMVSVESLRSSEQKTTDTSFEHASHSQSDEHRPVSQVMQSQISLQDDAFEAHSPNRLQNDEGTRTGAAADLTTPLADAASPSQPPTPLQAALVSKPQETLYSPSGTNRRERALRAIVALQSVPFLQDSDVSYSQTQLGSPYDESKTGKSSLPHERYSGTSDKATSRQKGRNEDMISGFSAATRRELKAGLRLGEELAKRQRQSLPAAELPQTMAAAVPYSQSSPLYPSLPSAYSYRDASLNETDSVANKGRRSVPSNPQLPSPASSDAVEQGDTSEIGKAWHVEDGNQSKTDSRTPQTQPSRPGFGGNIDRTMLDREAEWQREREAVKKQIQEANASQVVVIDGETTFPEVAAESSHAISGSCSSAPGQDSFVARLDSSLDKSLYADKESKQHLRRSKLPSPWVKRGQLQGQDSVYQSESSEADLFWQPDAFQKRKFAKNQRRRQGSDESANDSSTSFTTSKNAISEAAVMASDSLQNTKANIHPQLGQRVGQSLNMTTQSPSSPSDSFAEHREDIQPTAELLETTKEHNMTQTERQPNSMAKNQSTTPKQNGHLQDSFAANRGNLQRTEELLAEQEVTITVSENVPPAVIPLPESPILDAMDPALFERPFDESTPFKPQIWDCEESMQSAFEVEQDESVTALPDESSIMAVGTKLEVDEPDAEPNESWKRAPPTTWWSTLVSLVHAGPSCPPATLDDILVSSIPYPLPLYLPTIRAHALAMKPLVWASIFYNPDIFPFNPDGPSTYLLYSDVKCSGWGREFTQADCGIVEAYLTLLKHRGVRPPKGKGHIDPKLEVCHIAYILVKIWAEMVMDGLTDISDWKRVRIGNRKQGDRQWTPRDVVRNKADMQFIHEKRKEFQEVGLPNWKHMGWFGPFKLAKPL